MQALGTTRGWPAPFLHPSHPHLHTLTQTQAAAVTTWGARSLQTGSTTQ